jgi:HD superfamily phosphohydrolase
MYWQVYLHKTVLSAEMLLVKIITRAKDLIARGEKVEAATHALNFFLTNGPVDINKHLDIFCSLDDYDVMTTIKNWMQHPDKILSALCGFLVDRNLLKVKLQAEPFAVEDVDRQRKNAAEKLNISIEETEYFVFTGEAMNTTYDPGDERINVLFKDETVRDISQVDNALIHKQISSPVKKYYFCYLRS